jgi:hypothetical protein
MMLTWSTDELHDIAQSDDLHIASVPRQSKSCRAKPVHDAAVSPGPFGSVAWR